MIRLDGDLAVGWSRVSLFVGDSDHVIITVIRSHVVNDHRGASRTGTTVSPECYDAVLRPLNVDLRFGQVVHIKCTFSPDPDCLVIKCVNYRICMWVIEIE